MKLLLSDNRTNQLEVIMKRGGLPREKEDAIIRIMLFRQSLIYLKAPKRYVLKLIRSNRIVKSENNSIHEYNSHMADLVNSELEKLLNRHGTGIEGIASATADDSILPTKMLVEDLKPLYKKKKGCHKYRKTHFRQMREQIEYIAQTYKFEEPLEEAIKKLELDKECMIYYFLLSVNLPNSMSDEHALKPSFIQGIIDIKSQAMNQYIKEAKDGMKDRERWEFLDTFDNAAILSFIMRQYIEHGETIDAFSKEDLHKEVKEWFKENG